MITKFRKLQDTWFAKTILILTGLSFMSLFGVAGYMGSVGKNRPAIKVDNYEMLQSEVFALLDKEITLAKRLFGDNFEVTDTIRLNMLQDIVQKNLNTMIVRNIAKKNNISISDDLIRQVIYSQPDFHNANGKFDINRLRQILSASGWSEQQYIDSIKQDIIKQNIIQNSIENINTPKILLKYMSKIDNQKRIFKYITIDTQNLPIDRKISEDEILQYYQDFNLNFMAPETRDISFFYITNEEISKMTKVSDADAEAYYAENKTQFETPETRKIVQMVFDSEEQANKALTELNNGKDFYTIAKELANQSQTDTDLGFVAKDMLLEELSDPIFDAKNNTVVGPIKTSMGWHIAKIASIKSASKMEKTKALAQIKNTLKKEKMYDEAYEIATNIEDQIGSGETFENIASKINAKINTVKNLQENGAAKEYNETMKKIVSSPDFIDIAFSYNAGEISQVIEFDDGFALLKVDTVYDSHPKDINEVRPEIVKMWETNERTAITQEITNDVVHDLENGDSIDEIAKRFGLSLKTTTPLTRNDDFAGLSENNMNDLFLEKINTPRIFNINGKEIIAVTDKIINATNDVKSNDKVQQKTRLDLYQEYANRLLSDFSSEYDVRIKYRLLGMAD